MDRFKGQHPTYTELSSTLLRVDLQSGEKYMIRIANKEPDKASNDFYYSHYLSLLSPNVWKCLDVKWVADSKGNQVESLLEWAGRPLDQAREDLSFNDKVEVVSQVLGLLKKMEEKCIVHGGLSDMCIMWDPKTKTTKVGGFFNTISCMKEGKRDGRELEEKIRDDISGFSAICQRLFNNDYDKDSSKEDFNYGRIISEMEKSHMREKLISNYINEWIAKGSSYKEISDNLKNLMADSSGASQQGQPPKIYLDKSVLHNLEVEKKYRPIKDNYIKRLNEIDEELKEDPLNELIPQSSKNYQSYPPLGPQNSPSSNRASSREEVATLCYFVGDACRHLFEFAEALAYLSRALDLCESDKDSLLYCNVCRSLASLYLFTGKQIEAANLIKSAETRARGLAPELAASLRVQMAECNVAMNEYDAAMKELEEAERVMASAHRKEHPLVMTVFSRMGGVLQLKGDYHGALEYYKKDEQLTKRLFGDPNLSLAQTYNEVGVVEEHLGDYAKAINYYERAFKIKLMAEGENGLSLVSTYINLTSVYYHLGNFAKAQAFIKRAKEINQRFFPPDHNTFAVIYVNLGLVHESLGQYDDAERYFGMALKIMLTAYGKDYAELGTVHNNLATVHMSRGDYNSAIKSYVEAMRIYKQSPSNNVDYATILNNIASACEQLSNYAKAAVYYEGSRAIGEKLPERNRAPLAVAYSGLGSLAMRNGNLTKAMALYSKASNILNNVPTREVGLFCHIYHKMSVGFLNQKMYSAAMEYSAHVVEIMSQENIIFHPTLVAAYNNLGVICDIIGDIRKALYYYKKAEDIGRKVYSESDSALEELYKNLAAIYKKAGDIAKAEKYHAKANTVRRVRAPSVTEEVVSRLADMLRNGELALAGKKEAVSQGSQT